jgi:serine/threonine-protein kinase
MAARELATIAGKYRLLSVLGEGGMGVVYRAEQLDATGAPMREVALKMLRAEVLKDPEFSKRFMREARVAARINSPNSVMLFESATTDDGQLFYSMELVNGPTLADVLQKSPTLPLERALRIVCQICEVLAIAHNLPEPVVHRDLKPENIFLEQDWGGEERIKVGDFGIAKLLSQQQSQLTTSDISPGTPWYMAPEQWKSEPVDGRADLYALGVIAYEMLAGSPPFSSKEGPLGLMYQHLHAAPPPLPDSVPPDVQQAIHQLLAKTPAERPGDPIAVRRAFQAALVRLAQPAIKPEAPPPPVPLPSAAPVERPRQPSPPPPKRDTPALGGPKAREAARSTPTRVEVKPPPRAEAKTPPRPAAPQASAKPAEKKGTPPKDTKVDAPGYSPISHRTESRKAARPGAGVLAWSVRIGAVLLVVCFFFVFQRSRDFFVWSARRNVKPLFYALLQTGVNPNATDGEGVPVLSMAARRGDTGMVRSLLDRRAYATAADLQGETALMSAAESQNVDTVQLLLDRGAPVDAKDGKGDSALIRAARAGATEVLSALLHHQADVNAANANGRTALMEAAANGHIATVQELLRVRADTRPRDSAGKRARDLAFVNGHGDVAKLLD